MSQTLEQLISNHQQFKEKYVNCTPSPMQQLAEHGQHPETMLIACSDSRVDPALVLQSHPGDLFVVRNVANIVPSYKKNNKPDSTSAALEYGIQFLQVKNLIIMGHSQCGGIQGLMNPSSITPNDFISDWAGQTNIPDNSDCDTCAQQSLLHSYQNCLTFPWIKQRIDQGKLNIHLWFFTIETGALTQYSNTRNIFVSLDDI